MSRGARLSVCDVGGSGGANRLDDYRGLMTAARVASIHIYPVKGEAGQELSVADVEGEGLAGDRRKRAPVQLVAAEDVDEDTRANFIVTMPADALQGAVGSALRLGVVELEVDAVPGGCPGVYARVRTPGKVSVGDPVEIIG
jgi:hypothetical protein